MKKLSLLIALLMLMSVVLFAQAPTGSITGTVGNGGDQKIIDAATVSLYRASDSVLVKVNLTDAKGEFNFEALSFGRYYVLASSSGKYKTYSDIVEVNNSTPVNIGRIVLDTKVTTLAAVTVEVKKPFIERKIDRTVINVDASPTNAGSTALEVLEKSPGVVVDKDGNITLKGKDGVIVMMDGRPSYLSGQQLSNLLKNMPASSIDLIEIMTNPSSKFDASGNSGVINIKTKKIKTRGVNGNVSTSLMMAKYFRSNSSVNMNYRNGNVNLFGSYGFSNWHGQNHTDIMRYFKDQETKQLETIFDQKGISEYKSFNNNFKIGLDYTASKKTTLGFVLSGNFNPSKDGSTNTSYLKDANSKTDSIVISDNHEDESYKNFAANVNLRHVFDSAGKEFTVDLDYVTYNEHDDQLLVSRYLDASGHSRKDASYIKGELPSLIKIYSAKTDFTLPLKNNTKIEAGLKSSYVTTDNDAIYRVKTSGDYEQDLGKTNHFIFKENINAAYVNFSKQVNKWGFQAGLRAENTNSKGHQLGNAGRNDSLFSMHYTDLFPTAFVSYEMNKKNTFSANYGRRVDRPNYGDLNPFIYFLDEYTYSVGNTLLQPQFTDNFEFTHTYNGFLNTTLNYSVTHDAFAEVLKQITSERKTFQTKENIATKTNYGIAVSANFPVTKFWNTNVYGNVMHMRYEGELSGGMLEAENTAFMGNVNNQFKFAKGWSAEASGFYRSKAIIGQIVINPMWRMDAGVQKQILKKKGSVKLSVRDIFQTQRMSGYVQYQDIDLNIKNWRDSRTVSFTFSYRFGKPMKSQSRKTGGAGDEQSRVGSKSN